MQALYLAKRLQWCFAVWRDAFLRRFAGDPSSVSRVRPDSDSDIEERRKAEVDVDIDKQRKQRAKSSTLALISCVAVAPRGALCAPFGARIETL